MSDSCAYIFGRECNSCCNAFNPYCRKNCMRLDNELKIGDAITDLLKKYNIAKPYDVTDIIGVHKDIKRALGE